MTQSIPKKFHVHILTQNKNMLNEFSKIIKHSKSINKMLFRFSSSSKTKISSHIENKDIDLVLIEAKNNPVLEDFFSILDKNKQIRFMPILDDYDPKIVDAYFQLGSADFLLFPFSRFDLNNKLQREFYELVKNKSFNDDNLSGIHHEIHLKKAHIEEELKKIEIEKGWIRRKKEQILKYKDLDSLTPAYNRNFVTSKINDLLGNADQKQFSMMYLDLDSFSICTKKYGFEYGDKLLKAFAQIIISVTENIGLVARWERDIFIVIFHNKIEGELGRQIFERIALRAENLGKEKVSCTALLISIYTKTSIDDLFKKFNELTKTIKQSNGERYLYQFM